jgi:hypothetical protein
MDDETPEVIPETEVPPPQDELDTHARVVVPDDLVEIFQNQEMIRRVFRFVRAMEYFYAACDGKTAPLKESDQNSIVDISDIVPRFKLPPQTAETDGLFLMSNGADGSETWEPAP